MAVSRPIETTLHVNGAARSVRVPPGRTLLSVLRDDLDLTGAKYGCGEAQCGACIVLLDGWAVPSCATPIEAAAGRDVTTIEGLARDGRLHPLQQAFMECGAMQCGYCIPGMIMNALALLRQNATPADDDIIQHMHPNLCRCGAYPRMLQAIKQAAATAAAGGTSL